jgi:hypothetical protein
MHHNILAFVRSGQLLFLGLMAPFGQRLSNDVSGLFPELPDLGIVDVRCQPVYENLGLVCVRADTAYLLKGIVENHVGDWAEMIGQ